MSRMSRIVVALICMWAPPVHVAGQAVPRVLPKEPSIFYPDFNDSGFQHAQPPSDAVLDALLMTPEAKLNSDRLRALNRTRLRGLFRVVRVHLTNTDEADWVVGGRFPMTAADGDWFWLVREANGQPKVVLFASGLSLELLTKQTADFKDVRTVWGSAAGYTLTNIYQFDGSRYRLVHAFTKTEKLR
jgi:hypothetical protein